MKLLHLKKTHKKAFKKHLLLRVINKKSFSFEKLFLVRAERLELSRREALDPKSSVSTNSTTPAIELWGKYTQ